GTVPDAVLPALLKQFEPTLKRSDFKPNRRRFVINAEALLLMIYGLLCVSFGLAVRVGSLAPPDEPIAALLGWGGSFLVVVPLTGLILLRRAWRRRDDVVREQFRTALTQCGPAHL